MKFGLRAPIVPQLKAILKDYPAGQVLSEGLQNAEDIRASQFSFMLDLRQHAGKDINPKLHRFTGPAFVLADNGNGFSDRDWKSLQNLHDSEKQDTPSEIGSFGMGTRSYFHYTDAIFVASKSTYVGLDPMEIVAEGGGWKLEIATEEAVARGIRLFDFPHIGCNAKDGTIQGTVFRLPLRLAEHAAGGFGKEISEHTAREMMQDFVKQLEGGELLLFLSHVRRVDLWVWERDAAEPTLVERVCKSFLEGSPVPRMPQWLPDTAQHSYASLAAFMAELDDQQRCERGKLERAVVQTSTLSTQQAPRQWLLAHRFDARQQLSGRIEQCKAVPVLGVAVPLDGQVRGRAFCFLPIGDLFTGLPAHLHACFQVKKDRRGLWLRDKTCSSLGLAGEQAEWAAWNEELITRALPALWREVLEDMAEDPREKERRAAGLMMPDEVALNAMARLPDLAQAEDAWKACAHHLYAQLADSNVLPHPTAQPGAAAWVAPSQARVVLAPSSAAFESLAPDLAQIYSRCKTLGPRIVTWLWLPPHVSQACSEHSGLCPVEVEAVLQALLSAPDVELPQLVPQLLALAEHASTAFAPEKHEQWEALLCDAAAWTATDGGLKALPQLFEPARPALASFQTYANNQLSESVLWMPVQRQAFVWRAVLPALRQWGLKRELTWPDCVEEAKHVEASGCVDNGHRLLSYIVARGGQSSLEASLAIQELSVIAFVPGHERSESGDVLRDATVAEVFAPQHLLPFTERKLVWAVASTAAYEWDIAGIGFRPLSPQLLVQQIRALAHAVGSGKGADDVAEHLFQACSGLSHFVRAEAHPPSAEWLQPLLGDMPWVPATSKDELSLQLLPPARVAHTSESNLSPHLGLLPQRWKCQTISALSAAVGISKQFSVQVLADELQAMVEEGTDAGAMEDLQVDRAVNLANEIGSRIPDPPPEGLLIPTACGKLLRASDVFIDDAKWVSSESEVEPVALLHPRITPIVGRKLGCTSVRDELARMCEGEGQTGCFGSDFGQQEDLVARLRSLLHDYHNPSDVFNEHVQNCDDAGAERVAIVLDTRQHPCKELVNDGSAKIMQGPALILASSKALTDADLQRIQRLGDSEKRSDLSKCGRFGVGLNTFYHLTDTIQLLANGSLHVFDPLQVAVARDKQAGRQFEARKLQASFPNMLAPFHDFSDLPTVFRLPLRKTWSKLGRPATVHDVKKLLDDFVDQSDELLVFAKCVHQLTVAVVSDDGAASELLEIERVTSVDGSTSPLMEALPATLEEVDVLRSEPRQVVGELRVSGTKRGKQIDSVWMVAHSLAVTDETLALVEQTMCLPHGAAALRISGTPRQAGGCMCCYLPMRNLPITPSSRPQGEVLLLHGCFDLSSSRKLLQLPVAHGVGSVPAAALWNAALLRGPVASSLRNLLDRRRTRLKSITDVMSWLGLVELPDDGAVNEASAPIRSVVRKEVVSMMVSHRNPVFPVLSRGEGQDRDAIKWLRADQELTLRDALPSHVEDQLVRDGLGLVSMPESLCKEFRTVADQDTMLRRLTADALCSFLRGLPDDPVPLALRRAEDINKMLEFVVAASASPDTQTPPTLSRLDGVPLLLCGDQSRAARFGERVVYLDWHTLLPMAQDRFTTVDQHKILFNASTSREQMETALHGLKVRRLALQDLIEYRNDIHQACLPDVTSKWIKSFWSLMWITYQRERSTAFSEVFADWTVLKAFTREGLALLPLKNTRLVFSVHQTDRDWAQDVAQVLLDLGIDILHEDHMNDENQRNLVLWLGVHLGDDALLELLSTIPPEHFKLKSTSCMKLLGYFASRRQLSQPSLKKIKALPIFLTADGKGGTKISLRCSAQVRFVCVKDDDGLESGHEEHLQKFDIPNVSILAWPTQDFATLYSQLGVELCSSSVFIVSVLSPAIPALALSGYASVRPFLLELERWDPEPDRLREDVYEAASRCAIVWPLRGNQPLRAEDVVSPDIEVADRFHETLQACLPAVEYHQHLKLLSCLGLRTSPSPRHLLACARVLHSMAGSAPLPAKVEKMSHCLVEELSGAMGRIWKEGEEALAATQLRLTQAATSESRCCEQALQLRVVLVVDRHLPALAEAERAAVALVRFRASHNLEAEEDPLHWVRHCSVRLAPMSALCTLALAPLAWARLPLIAHSLHDATGRANPFAKQESKFAWLVKHYELQLCKLGVYTLGSQLPLSALTHQLATLSWCALKLDPPFRFPAHSLLEGDVGCLFSALAARLLGCQSAAEIPHLGHLHEIPCIPKVQTQDASGALEGGGVVTLLRPDRCFERLPETRAGCEQQVFAEVHIPEKHAELYMALGVRRSPDLGAWAEFTRIVWTQIHAGGGEGVSVLPPELAAIKAALHAVASLLREAKDPPSAPLELFLCDDSEDGSVFPTSCLVWNDRDALLCRCKRELKRAGVRVLSTKLVELQRDDYRRLCQYTTLRPLSKLVVESVAPAREVEASAGESALRALVQSEAFAHGVCSVATSKADASAVQRVLGALQWKWTAELRSVLSYSNGSELEGLGEPEGEASRKHAFYLECVGTSVLWLQAHRLDDLTCAPAFLRAVAEVLQSVFISSQLRLRTKEKGLLAMLECWQRGPAALGPALAAADFSFDLDQCTLDFESGKRVPLQYHRHLSFSMLCAFTVNEVVAVARPKEEGLPVYVFGRVCLPTSPALRAPPSTGSLKRTYSVHCGGTEPEQLSVEALYQIVRYPHHSTAAADGLQLQPAALGEEAGGLEAGQGCETEWEELVAQLREMEGMGAGEYKTRLHRLYKQWHPDHCRKPHASLFLRTLIHHSNTFNGDRDFSWLGLMESTEQELCSGGGASAAGPAVPEAAAGAARAGNSWVEEFEREMREEAEAVQRRQQQQQQQQEQQRMFAQLQAGASPAPEHRQFDERLADLYWIQAQNNLKAARVLLGSGQSANSAWSAQQTAEMVIKGLMLRTCGLAEEEEKGKGAHDLVKHMSRVVQSQDEWPVAAAELEWISWVYISARYPKSGALRAPFEEFDEDDATRAVRVAEKVAAWANSTYQLDTPPPGEAGFVKVPCGDQGSVRLHLDPAPVPPPPELEAQAAAPTVASGTLSPLPAATSVRLVPPPPQAPQSARTLSSRQMPTRFLEPSQFLPLPSPPSLPVSLLPTPAPGGGTASVTAGQGLAASELE